MYCNELHLKEFYPNLGEAGRDPTLTVYLPDNLGEICLLYTSDAADD